VPALFHVVRADELLALNQPLGGDQSFKSVILCGELLSENFKVAVRHPEIPNAVAPLRHRLAFSLCFDVAERPAQKFFPNSIAPENRLKIALPAIRDPESAVDNEPRRR